MRFQRKKFDDPFVFFVGENVIDFIFTTHRTTEYENGVFDGTRLFSDDAINFTYRTVPYIQRLEVDRRFENVLIRI